MGKPDPFTLIPFWSHSSSSCWSVQILLSQIILLYTFPWIFTKLNFLIVCTLSFVTIPVVKRHTLWFFLIHWNFISFYNQIKQLPQSFCYVPFRFSLSILLLILSPTSFLFYLYPPLNSHFILNSSSLKFKSSNYALLIFLIAVLLFISFLFLFLINWLTFSSISKLFCFPRKISSYFSFVHLIVQSP